MNARKAKERRRMVIEETGALELSTVEKAAIHGFGAREMNLQLQVQRLMEELTRERDAVHRTIEERLGLASSAIGTTHQLLADQGIVRPVRPPAPQVDGPIDLPAVVAERIANGAVPAAE